MSILSLVLECNRYDKLYVMYFYYLYLLFYNHISELVLQAKLCQNVCLLQRSVVLERSGDDGDRYPPGTEAERVVPEEPRTEGEPDPRQDNFQISKQNNSRHCWRPGQD